MPKATKICKVCGTEYEYCKTKADGQFRWMDVACSPEHATEYFRQIAISRGEITEEQPKPASRKKPKVEPAVEEPQDEVEVQPEAEDEN